LMDFDWGCSAAFVPAQRNKLIASARTERTKKCLASVIFRQILIFLLLPYNGFLFRFD
jgi:hypothetical protein